MHQRADARLVAQVEHEAEDRVVQQVFTDRPFGHDRDAKTVKQGPRADAGTLAEWPANGWRRPTG